MIAAPYRNAGESLHGSPSRLVSPAGNFSAMLDFCIAPIPSKSPLKILRIPEFRVPALFLSGVRIVSMVERHKQLPSIIVSAEQY